jgi:A/G-specific adenine glycosylase
MDLASGICTARAPLCATCPLATLCASRGKVPIVEAKTVTVPFAMTTRWLRGRLIAAVTAAPVGTWVPLPERLGHHDAVAIGSAARSLEREGFLDLHAGEARARS